MSDESGTNGKHQQMGGNMTNTGLLHFYDSGETDLPALVLGGAIGTELSLWEEFAHAVHGNFRTIRYDHVGHGGSRVFPGVHSIAGFAGLVFEVLDELGISEAHFAGVSLGSLVAAEAAMQHPGRVLSLTLMGTAARIGTPDMWEEREELALAGRLHELRDLTAERWFSERFAPSTRAAHVLDSFASTSGEGYAAGSKALGAFDMTDRLHLITCPTLVISGQDDTVTPPEAGESVARGVSGPSELMVIPNGRHMFVVEYGGDAGVQTLNFVRTLAQ